MIIPNEVLNIMDKLKKNNYEAYIIGGAVRDILLNLEPHDYDIFTNATALATGIITDDKQWMFEQFKLYKEKR